MDPNNPFYNRGTILGGLTNTRITERTLCFILVRAIRAYVQQLMILILKRFQNLGFTTECEGEI